MATVAEALVPPSEVLAPEPVVTEAPTVETDVEDDNTFERVECWLKYLDVIRTHWQEEDFTWEPFTNGVDFRITLRTFIDTPATIEELQHQVIDLLRRDANTMESSLGVRKVEVDGFAVMYLARGEVKGLWLTEDDAEACLQGCEVFHGKGSCVIRPAKVAVTLDAVKGGAL